MPVTGEPTHGRHRPSPFPPGDVGVVREGSDGHDMADREHPSGGNRVPGEGGPGIRSVLPPHVARRALTSRGSRRRPMRVALTLVAAAAILVIPPAAPAAAADPPIIRAGCRGPADSIAVANDLLANRYTFGPIEPSRCLPTRRGPRIPSMTSTGSSTTTRCASCGPSPRPGPRPAMPATLIARRSSSRTGTATIRARGRRRHGRGTITRPHGGRWSMRVPQRFCRRRRG